MSLVPQTQAHALREDRGLKLLTIQQMTYFKKRVIHNTKKLCHKISPKSQIFRQHVTVVNVSSIPEYKTVIVYGNQEKKGSIFNKNT